MCGIGGIINLDGSPVEVGCLRAMAGAVSHRGPDSEGFWLGSRSNGFFFRGDELKTGGNMGLCHRRLSIIDLTPAGIQPMACERKKTWIVYNGEVYNYIEIRRELESLGHRFHSSTDTEVILASYRQWGRECMSRFNGMWAFAILDLENGGLFCARDRLGVKPFYYHFDGKRFVFASEIKQFLALPDIDRTPDYGVLYDYLAHALVDHSERTFYWAVRQLRGGHYLWIPFGSPSEPRPTKYWDIDLTKKIVGWTDSQYAEHFLELFTDSVRLRLRSDVPVGSCLSGGLDSSGIVCMAARLLKDEPRAKQKTFSSCFEDPKYDERRFVAEVLRSVNVSSHCAFASAEGLMEELEKVMRHQDEPFASTSIYAQWSVFKLARASDTPVMLDGQGADEILAGYHGYYGPFFATLLRRGKIKTFSRELACYKSLHGYTFVQAARSLAPSLFGETARAFSLEMSARRIKWLDREFRLEGARLSPYYSYLSAVKWPAGATAFDRKLYEMLFYTNLPALLHYEDRNSMAFSIEAREPFLDYRLVEFAFSSADEQKIRNGYTKHIYREALKTILPEAIRLRHDKMGFVTPEEHWIRKELREWFEETIESVSEGDEVFNKKELKKTFARIIESPKPFEFTPWRWANAIKWKGMSR